MEQMTYTSLLDNVLTFTERQNDTSLADNLPQLINLAENTIASDLKILGFRNVVNGQMQIGGSTIPKPAFWRESVYMQYTVGSARVPIYLRDYAYCRRYWPDPAVRGTPRFYADYNAENFLIVATPEAAYPFELTYYARLEPLDTTHQTNWMTRNVPQLLLSQTMVWVSLYTKNSGEQAKWEGRYGNHMASLNGEAIRQQVDEGTIKKSG